MGSNECLATDDAPFEMRSKNILLPLSGLLAISATVGVGWNLLIGNRSAWSRLEGMTPAATTPRRVSRIADVGFGDLRNWLSRGKVVLLDARNVSEFQAGNLPGAWSMPVDAAPEVLTQIGERLKREAMGKAIVVYCSGVTCDDADRLAIRLSELNLKRQIFIYRGGWEEWHANIR